MKDIIVIVGPTGVGKTKCSIELAKSIDAEIINGDSVAIYKGLDIGSAKPTKEEQDNIPHHLIDIKEVDEDYTVYEYQKDCREKIKEIQSRNKRVIIVGGTGLYMKAALYNYQFTEGTTYKDYIEYSNEELLAKIKKQYTGVLPELNNRKRLVRLLNKLENKETITNQKDECLYPIKVIGLTTNRETLYERINKRVDCMIENGLLKEIESMKDKYKNSRILNSGIGYKEFNDYLFHDKRLEDVIEEIKKDSRHFAKRQYTFFNHQFNTHWIEVDFNSFSNTIKEVEDYIKKDA